ncbi:MAG: hypothetical protein RRY12_03520 [Cloacibacillus sp.]
MARNLEPLENIISSKSGRESGVWKSISFALIALYLLTAGVWQIYHDGLTGRAALNIFLGLCSIVVTKYEKRIYLSPEGFVKETHTWFSHHRDMLPWSEIQHVTLMSKGEKLLAFIERDTLGWKLLFERKDIPLLKETIKQHAPKIPIRIDESNSRF